MKEYFISFEFWVKYSNAPTRHMTAFVDMDIKSESVNGMVKKLVNQEFPGFVDDSFESKIVAFNNIN